jgi:hypothetical protein
VTGFGYNQPKFCPNATWDASAVTLANVSIIGSDPCSMVVNKNNTVFVGNFENRTILIWSNSSLNPTKKVSNFSSNLHALFALDDDGVLAQSSSCPMMIFNHWSTDGILMNSYSVPYALGRYVYSREAEIKDW